MDVSYFDPRLAKRRYDARLGLTWKTEILFYTRRNEEEQKSLAKKGNSSPNSLFEPHSSYKACCNKR